MAYTYILDTWQRMKYVYMWYVRIRHMTENTAWYVISILDRQRERWTDSKHMTDNEAQYLLSIYSLTVIFYQISNKQKHTCIREQYVHINSECKYFSSPNFTYWEGLGFIIYDTINKSNDKEIGHFHFKYHMHHKYFMKNPY